MLPKPILDAKTFVANLPIPEPRDVGFASNSGVREDIERKLARHAADFVRSLPDL